jgi:hypothetical protein
MLKNKPCYSLIPWYGIIENIKKIKIQLVGFQSIEN